MIELVQDMANNNPIEAIRHQLNKIPEKDNQGNYNRLGWQILTYIFGKAIEESNNPKLKNLGKVMRVGAKQSFADYAVQKIVNWLDKMLDSKSCPYCGYVNNLNDVFCNQCRNYFY